MNFKPLVKYFLQFSIIEFNIEGTPGNDNTFLVIKPGAALDGLYINLEPLGIFAIFFLPSLNFFFP